MFGISVTRLIIYGIIAAAVIGVLFMLRHELIEKGKNLVYAEDNAARVKAQEKQTADDAVRIRDQQKAIADLTNSGNTVKERIKYVQGPCKNDGSDDPRLGMFDEWLRGRSGDNGAAGGGPPPKGTMPAARK